MGNNSIITKTIVLKYINITKIIVVTSTIQLELRTIFLVIMQNTMANIKITDHSIKIVIVELVNNQSRTFGKSIRLYIIY